MSARYLSAASGFLADLAAGSNIIVTTTALNITSATQPYLYAAIYARNMAGAALTINSLRWDFTGTNQAFSLLSSAGHVAIYELKNPTQTSSTVRLDITRTGASPASCIFGVVAFGFVHANGVQGVSTEAGTAVDMTDSVTPCTTNNVCITVATSQREFY